MTTTTTTRKSRTKKAIATPAAPAASSDDRVVGQHDNMPPERLPLGLATAEEIKTVIAADVDGLKDRAVGILDTFSRMPERIEDDDVYARGVTLATMLKEVVDEVEKKRTGHKAPYLAAERAIDATFKLVVPKTETAPERVLRKELDAAHAAVKGRLSRRDTELYEAEQERVAAERKRIAAMAAQDGIEMGDAPEVGGVTTQRSQHGGLAVKNVVSDWTVVDETLLPRSVLSVDPAKVKALIEGGATSIPGIEITRKVETHVKRK